MAAAVAALLLPFALVAGEMAPASAAPIASSSVELLTDGTAHGTANGCTVENPDASLADASPTDGMVCTDDSVTYGWNYSVPAGGANDVTFTQTLPAGWTWDPISITSCQGGDDFTGTATISSDGLTLTCVLTFANGASSRSGQLPVVAIPQPGIPNGSVYTAELTVTQSELATPQVTTAAAVTVRSQPRWDVSKAAGGITYGLTADFGNGPEAAVSVSWAVYIRSQSVNNFKGQDPLAGGYSFTDVVTGIDPQAMLQSCDATFGLVCTQPGGPGTDVTWTIADDMVVPDTLPWGPGYAQAWTTVLLVPLTNVPVNPDSRTITNQVNGFDPVGVGGDSNLGSDVESGSGAGETCATVGNNNCAQLALTTQPSGVGSFSALKSMRQTTAQPSCEAVYWGCDSLVGVTGTSIGNQATGNLDGVVYAGQEISGGLVYFYDTTREAPTNVVLCDKWDPALQLINPGAFGSYPYSALTEGTFEYTARVYADDDERRTAGCGAIGDTATDGPWFSSVAAAGGAAAVTGVRWLAPVGATTIQVPFVVPMGLPEGTLVKDFLSARFDQNVTTENPLGWYPASLDAYRITNLQLTLDKDTAPKGLTGAVSGARVNYTLDASARLLEAGPVREVFDLQVVDTLSPCLTGLQLSPATTDWNVSITPGDRGPDGVACTADDVSGDVATFTPKNPVFTDAALQQIGYSVIVSPLVTNGQQLLNTAVITSQDVFTSAPSRTDQWVITVAAPGAVRVSKVVDQSVVEVEPDPVSWTITYSNTLSTDLGTTTFIDLLPYNGDGRGTAFNGAFGFTGASVTSGADTSLYYTTDAVGTVVTDPAANTSVWVEASAFTGDPATVTALKIVADDLVRGESGQVRVFASPTGNVEGDIYANSVSAGRADGLEEPLPATLISSSRVVASTIGDRVWFDADSDGVQDAGETGIDGVGVQLIAADGVTVLATATTAGDGNYSFGNLHSGTYSTRIVSSTLPVGYAATYDLDGGTGSPNGDSGAVALPRDTDFLDADFGYNLVEASIVVRKAVDGSGSTFAIGPYDIVVDCTLGGLPIAGFPRTLTFAGAGDQTVAVSQGAVCTASETSTGGATSVDVEPEGGVTATAAGDQVITVTNVFQSGSLVITKLIDGVGGADFGDGPFVFGVDCSFNGTPSVFTDTVTLTRVGDESSLVSAPLGPLPIGAQCVITETDDGGADATPAPVTVTIVTDDTTVPTNTVTALITNEFSAGTLELTKVVDGGLAGADYLSGLEFTVQLTCQIETEIDGSPVRTTVFSGPVTITGGETVPITVDGEPLTLPVGTHCFGEETVTGGASATSIDADSYENAVVVIAGGPDDLQQLTITATNTFDPAQFTVSKTVVGPGTAGPFSFEVVCTIQGAPYRLDDGDAQFELSDGESRTITVLDGVDCTVIEANAPDGDTVSYADSDGSTDGTVSAISGEAGVAVTNTFDVPPTTEPTPDPSPTTPPTGGTPTGSLPNTGFVVGGTITIAALLLLAGGFALIIRRRRARES